MCHRIITVLFIAGYLAGQIAGLPHTHTTEQPGHGRAHVHCDWFTRLFQSGQTSHLDHHSHSHSHSHSHADEHAADHHHGEHNVPESRVSGDSGHDDTCVYLPNLGAVPASNKTVHEPQENSSLDAIVVVSAVGPSHSTLMSDIESKAPPDGLLLGCARFLKLRTLRI
jgi:hypothetical protein